MTDYTTYTTEKLLKQLEAIKDMDIPLMDKLNISIDIQREVIRRLPEEDFDNW